MGKLKALQDSLVEYTFKANKRQKLDIEMFLASREEQVKAKLKKYLTKHKNLKFDIACQVVLGKLEVGEKKEEIIQTQPWFRSEPQTVYNEYEFDRKLTLAIEKVLDSYDNFMRMGSGWFLIEVLQLELKIYKYKPLRGGCFATKLPEPYDKMRGLLTFPQTGDNKCFLYCILAHMFPQKTKKGDFLQYLKYEDRVNSTSLRYPVSIDGMSTFEKDNEISINVYQLQRKRSKQEYFAKCVRVSENSIEATTHINLLLHENHYHLITNLSTFLRYKNRHRRWQCNRCLKFYKTQDRLKRHSKLCKGENSKATLVFPKPGEKQQFKNFQNIPKAPFVLYCDLETYARPLKNTDNDIGKTKKEARHMAMAFGLYCVCSEEKFSDEKPVIYVGEDAVEQLFRELEEKLEYIHSIQKSVNYPIDMSKMDKRRHRSARRCYICKKKFDQLYEKMRDHNHLKRKNNYLGPVCIACNLHCSAMKGKVPLYFHNAGRFDIHLLVEKLHELDHQDFKILAKTTETFTAMTLFGGKLEIRDSINHLPNSLSDLVKLNKDSGKQFKHTEKWANIGEESLNLVTRKGVFPHSYMTHHRKLLLKKLPDAQHFYDSLTEKAITTEDYEHSKMVWEHFSCKTLEDYMRVYLTSDVTLLADIFETYRDFFKAKFDLDPAHYVSLPSLSYDCALKYTKCKIEHIHDEDTYHFIKAAVRGGVSTISKRFAKANNPYLGEENYDPDKPNSFIMYFDCNSLYSSVMTMNLPYKKFKFLQPEQFPDISEKIQNYHDDDNVGYFIQCDLEYPKKIHNRTKDLPLAPRHFDVERQHLSPYNLELADSLGIRHYSGRKLISDQFNKTNYICHIANLKFYLEKGLKLNKIHRVLQFEQKAFLKPYIDLCIQEKGKTSSKIEKNLWKLSCNSIFGKTITNMEKRCRVNFASTEKQLVNSVNSPLFKSASIVNSKLVQTNKAYGTIRINSPYIFGATILELSKLILYRWHYDYFVKRFGRGNIDLCLTDTDSLLYEIQHEDVYKELKNEPNFDFSNYPVENQFHNQTYNGQLFCMKDEVAGKPIKSFVGLRAKSYSIEFADKTRKITGKGVPKYRLAKITHEDMKRTLFQKIKQEVTSKHIRSFKHKLYNTTQKKVALSPFDNKRYILGGGIRTLPLGHYSTRHKKSVCY